MTVEDSNVNSGNLIVVQRRLTTKDRSPPGESLSYGNTAIVNTGLNAIGTLEMAYNAADEFDFTDFLTCNVDEIDLIAAIGFPSTTQISYHKNRVQKQKLTRLSSCTCQTNTSSSNNVFD